MVDCLNIDGIKNYDSSQIAQEFGKHFSTIRKTYAKKTKQSANDIHYYNKKINENAKTMFLNPISEHEISK